MVIEAWAQGCPVVAADASGPEALIDNGNTGLLVAREDVDGLAAALNRLIAEPDTRQKLVEKGREAWQAEFTEQAVVQHYMDFFANVTDQA